MARLYYGDDIFDMDDDPATGLQEIIMSAVSQGRSIWLPMPESRSENQYRVTELLVGPGIPIRFEYRFSSQAEAGAHVDAGVQRTKKMFEAPGE